MRSVSTTLAATLFAVVVFTIPAAAEIHSGDETIDGTTYIADDSRLSDYAITIKNGGVLSVDWEGLDPYSLSIIISDSSYLVSTSDGSTDGSTAAVTGTGSLYVLTYAVEISFDSDYLADLVAGTATEYTYQIFDSAILSNSYFVGVTVDDSWQDTDGIASVTYDESTGTVTVTIAVPEPSAFGTFAGISALALVAAPRRRRSRKIA